MIKNDGTKENEKNSVTTGMADGRLPLACNIFTIHQMLPEIYSLSCDNRARLSPGVSVDIDSITY